MKVDKKRDKLIASTKWLELIERYYLNNKNEIGCWTFVKRTLSQGAAIIVAKTKETSSYIITKQFRVPFADYIFEFPAGLIDIGESPGAAALRELEEETGYRGRVTKVSCPLSSSAGLTSEIIYLVYIECDEEPKSKVKLEASEELEVFKINPSDISSFLNSNKNSTIDSKLYAILEGGQDGNAVVC